jgi:hypothetical protein
MFAKTLRVALMVIGLQFIGAAVSVAPVLAQGGCVYCNAEYHEFPPEPDKHWLLMTGDVCTEGQNQSGWDCKDCESLSELDCPTFYLDWVVEDFCQDECTWGIPDEELVAFVIAVEVGDEATADAVAAAYPNVILPAVDGAAGAFTLRWCGGPTRLVAPSRVDGSGPTGLGGARAR